MRDVVEAELRGLSDDYRTSGVLGLGAPSSGGWPATAAMTASTCWPTGRGGGSPATWPAGRRWCRPAAAGSRSSSTAATATGRRSISAAAITLKGGERLLVGRDSQAQTLFRGTLLSALGWALGVGGVLALASGWFLSRYVGRRVADVVQTAEEIVQGDMARRVPVRGRAGAATSSTGWRRR